MDTINKIIEEISVEAKDKGLDSLSKKIDKLGKNVLKLEDKFKKVNDNFLKSTQTIKETENGFEMFMNKLSRSFIAFNGNMLSIMFFGMEIQRVFTGALKSIFEEYKKIIPQQSEFNILTTKLSANWEFFKFQLAQAFAQSDLFRVLIGYAINLLRWFEQFSPTTKKLIVVLLILGAAIGGVLEKIGMMSLGIASLYNLMKITFTKTVTDVNGLQTVVSRFSWGTLGKIGVILAIVAAFILAKKSLDVFYKSSKYAEKQQKLLKKSIISTINSALIPISRAFHVGSIKVNNFNEFLIIVGVTVHNMITIFFGLIDVVIFLARVFINAGDMIVRSLVAPLDAIKVFAKSMYYLVHGDFKKAWNSAMNSVKSFSSSMIHDLYNIGDAFSTLKKNLKEKVNILAGYKPALDAYRKSIEGITNATKDYNNVASISNIFHPSKYSSYITPMNGASKTQNITNNNIIVIDKNELSNYMTEDQINTLQSLLNGVQGSGY